MTTVRREPPEPDVRGYEYNCNWFSQGIRDLADKRHVVGCGCITNQIAYSFKIPTDMVRETKINACTDLARALVEFRAYDLEEP